MRRSFLLAGVTAFTMALGAASAMADIVVPITETKDASGAETLSISGYPGATIAGTTDNWTITFPGITLRLDVYFPLVYVEGPGEEGFNVLSFVNRNTLRLTSEVAKPSWPGCNSFPWSSAMPLGWNCYIGRLDVLGVFVTVNEVKAAAPEPATWSMMGLGFAGLAFAGLRTRRTAV